MNETTGVEDDETEATVTEMTTETMPEPPFAQWICCHDAEPFCDWCACSQSEEECGCTATLGPDVDDDGLGVVCLHCGIELDPIDFDTGERASGEQIAVLLAELRGNAETVN